MKIFWRTIGTKQLFGTIDFHSRKKNTMEVNGAKVPIVLQNILLCVSCWVSKWWQNFHFLVEYPFKKYNKQLVGATMSFFMG